MLRFRREVAGLFSSLVLLLTVGCLQGWAACDDVPAGQTLRIRLSQPVSSYSAQPGMPLRGILIESPECDGLPLFPQGTAVEGRVQSVRKVGLGFRHETAVLELEFDLISPGNPSQIDQDLILAKQLGDFSKCSAVVSHHNHFRLFQQVAHRRAKQ